MTEYRSYALTLRPRVRFAALVASDTLIQSDTFFGSLCWAIRYAEDADALRVFLESYQTSPPLLLSTAFPQGALPVPVLPPLTREQVARLAEERFDGKDWREKLVNATTVLKRLRDLKYLPLETFRNIAGNLSAETLTRALLDALGLQSPIGEQIPEAVWENYAARAPWQSDVAMRTAVDRLSWQARDGALFDDAQEFFERDAHLTVWVRLNAEMDAKKDWLMRRFRDLARAGFGGRLSTGAGEFEIIGELEPADELLPRVENANAFVTLAAFTPRAGDPTEGSWERTVKRGKLGGYFSTNAAPGRNDPHVWKKPLILFQPGAVFKTGDTPRDFYGGLVPRIHPLDAYKDVVQYAYAFPVSVCVKGGAR